MSDIKPNQCYICYKEYNNDNRIPLILTCLHTYCKECITKIFKNITLEIICPECKQITKTENDQLNKLKNRIVLDLLNYMQEQKKQNSNNPIKKLSEEEQKKIEEKIAEYSKTYEKYEEILNSIEKKYLNMYKEYDFLKEDAEKIAMEKVDEILDKYIAFINSYRNEIHSKIKKEFRKNDNFKNFEISMKNMKKKNKEFSEVIENEIYSVEFFNKNNNNKENDYINSEKILRDLTSKEKDIENEIKFIDYNENILNLLSKEISNPLRFLYLNKSGYQNNGLQEDLKKILFRLCAYEEEIYTYKINNLEITYNNTNFSKIFQETNSSNIDKVKCLFKYFRLKPNFLIYWKNNNNFYGKLGKGYFNLYRYLSDIKDEIDLRNIIEYLIKEYDYFPVEFNDYEVNEAKMIKEYSDIKRWLD